MIVRIGTRSSRLAFWQARRIATLLSRARPGVEVAIVEMSTHGDEVGIALPEIGGEGVFTERIERALLDRSIDVAVHSLKDLPVEPRAGLTNGAVLDRTEVREALVTRTGGGLESLPAGAVVGSSSTRRSAQLLALRPDLVVRPIRGNVETRVAKVDAGQYDATLLAGAGLERLGLTARIGEWLGAPGFLPAPGQGALAVQCRADDAETLALLRRIDDPDVHAATDAERGFLRLLGCGCSAPVAAIAVVENGRLRMRARISAPDGSRTVDVEGAGRDPRALAAELVARARASGADAILAGIRGGGPGFRMDAPRRLDGVRVLVTRAVGQSAGLCAALAARGAVPVLLPVIRVETLPAARALLDAARDPAAWDWLVFTSANGVAAFFEAVGETAARAVARSAAVAAVGPATAEALAAFGVGVALVPERHDGASLAAAMRAATPKGLAGARILFPRAERAREEAIAGIRAAGAVVEDVPVYRTVPATITDGEIAAAIGNGIDAILFMSGSAVHAFCDAADGSAELAAAARGAAVACLGPSATEAAVARGLAVAVTADERSAGGIVDALARHVATATKET